MSRKSLRAANGALAMPSSSPWYTYGVPWCRCRTVASVLAEAARYAPSSPNRDTGRGWSWLLQYSEFQPRPARPACQAASDAFSKANVGRSSAEATNQIDEIVAIAHHSGVTVEVIVATAWDCPFEGPTPPQRVLDIAAAARDRGVDRFSIADTIGTTTPGRVSSLIAQLRPVIGELPLGGHFHNTRGAGLASAYAAVSSGVTRLDASVGRLGGCPFAPGATGNIATEDLVYLLRDSGIGVDVDLQAAITAAEVAKSVVGHDLPSALLRAGDRTRT